MSVEQRQLATRVLCWVLVISGALTIVSGVATMVALFLDMPPTFRWLMRSFFFALAPHMIVGAVLAIWRSCDRCGFHLYPYQNLVGGLTGAVIRFGGEERYPDHRAERFLGSWRWGGIVSMATKGTAHCVWCGHADGAKLPTQ